jgi:alpha-beta hydrolase superfamily lysophospholipase
MKRAFKLFAGFASFSILFFYTAISAKTSAAPEAIVSRIAEVDGVELHYLTAGHGPAVILLHGYTQTSRMWRPVIPLLAEKFTVIAPDLPGIGDSDIPAGGLAARAADAKRWREISVSTDVNALGSLPALRF